MRRAALAEWALSMFLDRRRAGAVIGDLAEQSRLSWFAVLRIAVSSMASDLRNQPGALLFLGLRAFIVLFGMEALRVRLSLASQPSELLACFLSGLWVAHRAPGREATAFLAMTLVIVVWASLMCLSVKAEFHLLPGLYTLAALLSGVMGQRYRRLSYANN